MAGITGRGRMSIGLSRLIGDGNRSFMLGPSMQGIYFMPAKSKAQQKAAGAALSAKRGDTKVSELQGASKDMYDSMSEDELEDFAKGERKGKPEHSDKND